MRTWTEFILAGTAPVVIQVRSRSDADAARHFRLVHGRYPDLINGRPVRSIDTHTGVVTYRDETESTPELKLL